MKKKISVAMAVFNGAEWLPEQLDSILLQLGIDDELIISYDESSDSTLDIIESYAAKDGRIKIVINKVPGVTGNFNSAISDCSGDFIFISDQDDKWSENKIKAVMQCFEETEADLVIHNGVDADEFLNPEDATFFEKYRIGKGKLRNILKFRGSGCCMAFTKQMKEKILPLPEIYGYDQWVAVICEFTGKVAYLDDVLIYHRLHSRNVTPDASRPLPQIINARTRLVVNLLRRLRKLG